MTLTCDYLKNQIIIPTLNVLGLNSIDAVYLLLDTCAQESNFGKYRKQLGGGPAYSIYQVELATFNDCVRYINTKPELKTRILMLVPSLNFADMENNDVLATIIARIKYWMIPAPIPKTLEGRAAYWKQYYNTPLGAGTEQEFISNHNRYVTC